MQGLSIHAYMDKHTYRKEKTNFCAFAEFAMPIANMIPPYQITPFILLFKKHHVTFLKSQKSDIELHV